MLTQDEEFSLDAKLQDLECIDPAAGDGLFVYVLLGEPAEQKSRYEPHLSVCEYCRVAKELYLYKRKVAVLLGQARRERTE